MKVKFSMPLNLSKEGVPFITIDQRKNHYGSLMKIWLIIGDHRVAVRPHDLTTQLVVTLPNDLVLKEGLKKGDIISGEIFSKDYKSPKIPNDVKEVLKLNKLDFEILSIREQRQILMFINESANSTIRNQRIQTLIIACQRASNNPNKA